MSASTLANPLANPLTAEHQRALRDAGRRMSQLRAASRVAMFNVWSTGLIAGGTVIMALFDWYALLGAALLVAITCIEWRGRARLRQLDEKGLRLLALNQAAFMVIIVLYSIWRIVAAVYGPNPYAQQIEANPEIENMLGGIGELHIYLSLAVYSCLIIATLIFQGGCSLYYRLRCRSLRDYLRQTPQWIVEMQRTAAL